ncbi:hypothetical protein PG985_014941 [Apiospora marii]|uniref:uncharacterized protein n=1 Tax=Apiospora marii TaxID=335849 RepID=UPI00312FE7E6
MSAQGGTPARPLSPWAIEYGVSHNNDLGDGRDHSLLNPIFPLLRPVFYNDLPKSNEGETDIDQILHSRYRQLADLGGIVSHQLGPLNEYLGDAGVRGGHSTVGYDGDQNRKRHRDRLLTVDEGAWFDCLKKERWWELNRGSLIDTRQESPIERWNPQEERIWNELCIILEFCNRTLTKLLEQRDPWLDALLFGDLAYSDLSPVPRVSSPSAPKDDPVKAIKYRSPTELPRRQEYFTTARDRLHRLTERLLFGFRAQASIARFSQACTILHELAHAIYRGRLEEYQLAAMPEAYMGEEQVREIGMSFTNHVFGGTMLGAPLPSVLPEQVSGQRITLTDRNLESKELIETYKQLPRDGWHVLRFRDNPTYQALIPPFVCSALFEQSHWDSLVSTKGTSALQPARLVAWRGRVILKSPHVDRFRQPLERLAEAMHQREQEVENRYRSRNPNKDRHESMWERSLWSHTSLRKDIAAFRTYHSRELLAPCRRIAERYVKAAEEGLQKPSAGGDRTTHLRGAYWVVKGIAYLREAANHAIPTAPVQEWRDPQDHTKSVTEMFQRRRGNVRVLNPPYEWLAEFKNIIKDKLFTISQVYHSRWVAECINTCNELEKRRGPWGDTWAPFIFRVPRFEPNNRIAASSLSALWLKSDAPGYQSRPEERFLLPKEIFEHGLVLVKAASPQGWSCYEIPKGQGAAVRNVWVKTPYGRALPGNRPGDKTVADLRAALRRSRPRGTLIPWYWLAEVAEFDGTLSMPDWRVAEGGVYDITKFLQSKAGKTTAATTAFPGPRQVYIDFSIVQDLRTLLRPYLCALIKPDNNTEATLPEASAPEATVREEEIRVWTKEELAHYDTPEHAYLDHHPAGYDLLARRGGRDITADFDQNHVPSLTAIDTGEARHTIVDLGRLVPAQTSIRNDQVVLDGYVFALRNLAGAATRRRWAGKVVPANLDQDHEDIGRIFALYNRGNDLAVAKYEDIAGRPNMTRLSKEDLKAHNATQSPPDKDSAWVAARQGNRYIVYNISDTINYPRFFPANPPCSGREIEWKALAGELTDDRLICQWLRENLSHREIGELSG